MTRPLTVPFDRPLGNSKEATGELGRLTDPGPAAALAALRASFKADPENARRWLLVHGFITPTGRLPKRYGG